MGLGPDSGEEAREIWSKLPEITNLFQWLTSRGEGLGTKESSYDKFVTRPWYLHPPRSKTTRETPLDFARSAMALPTAAARSVLLLPLREASNALSASLAAARGWP